MTDHSRYTLLKGQFVIRYDDLPNNGPEPDGDTVKFKPDNDDLVWKLPKISGRKAKLNARGISVRLEAIDATETHFMNAHQEIEGAHAARDRMLAECGFTDVVWDENHPERVVSANADSLPGWALSNGIDANGRMIGFIFADSEALGENGASIEASVPLIDRSINAHLLKDGLVYPAFYKTLPDPLRKHLSTVAVAARKHKLGIWPQATASPESAAEVTDLASIEALTMWPKLFRRLVSYFHDGNEGLGELDQWMHGDRIKRDDAMLRLDTHKVVHFHEWLQMEGNMLKMIVEPEMIVVTPDPVSADPQDADAEEA